MDAAYGPGLSTSCIADQLSKGEKTGICIFSSSSSMFLFSFEKKTSPPGEFNSRRRVKTWKLRL